MHARLHGALLCRPSPRLLSLITASLLTQGCSEPLWGVGDIGPGAQRPASTLGAPPLGSADSPQSRKELGAALGFSRVVARCDLVLIGALPWEAPAPAAPVVWGGDSVLWGRWCPWVWPVVVRGQETGRVGPTHHLGAPCRQEPVRSADLREHETHPWLPSPPQSGPVLRPQPVCQPHGPSHSPEPPERAAAAPQRAPQWPGSRGLWLQSY